MKKVCFSSCQLVRRYFRHVNRPKVCKLGICASIFKSRMDCETPKLVLQYQTILLADTKLHNIFVCIKIEKRFSIIQFVKQNV